MSNILKAVAVLGAYYFFCFITACIHTYLSDDMPLGLVGLTLVWSVTYFLGGCVLAILYCIGEGLK